MFDSLVVSTSASGALKEALTEAGWVDGDILAAGQLRQGKAPSMLGMVVGYAAIEVLRPKRSKLLPRHFVLAATADRVVVFKATGGSPESDAGNYQVRIQPGEHSSWARSEMRIVDLAEGEGSKGGTMVLKGERFPVARPNLNGDPSTDELIALLAAGA
jgi:hypothetical protein